MDKPLVAINYKLANGNEVCIEVSPSVKELLEQTDRQIRSQRRQDRRRLNFVDCVDDLLTANMTDPQEDTANLIVRMESYEQLYTAIEKLSEVQRRRVRLYYGDGLNHRQIAELEGVRTSAVGHSIRQATARLHKYLAEKL